MFPRVPIEASLNVEFGRVAVTLWHIAPRNLKVNFCSGYVFAELYLKVVGICYFIVPVGMPNSTVVAVDKVVEVFSLLFVACIAAELAGVGYQFSLGLSNVCRKRQQRYKYDSYYTKYICFHNNAFVRVLFEYLSTDLNFGITLFCQYVATCMIACSVAATGLAEVAESSRL